MPKHKRKTAELKAKRLTKVYVESGLNGAVVAKKEGVSRQAIHKRLKRAPVQETLADYLKDTFPKSYVKGKFKDGLEAKKADYTGKKPKKVSDLYCRHRYLVTLLEVQKDIKSSEHDVKGAGNVIIQIIRPAKDEGASTDSRIHINRALLAETDKG